jgi:TonB family protein
VPDFDVDVAGGLWADNIKFDSKDYNWEEYSTKLYFAVYRAWLRELLGRVRRFERDQILNDLNLIEGQVSIRFRLVRDGSARGVSVVDPSVIPTLDEASRAAIERAVLPPLPGDFPRDEEGVTFRFVITGFESATQIEWQLKRLQARGEF